MRSDGISILIVIIIAVFAVEEEVDLERRPGVLLGSSYSSFGLPRSWPVESDLVAHQAACRECSCQAEVLEDRRVVDHGNRLEEDRPDVEDLLLVEVDQVEPAYWQSALRRHRSLVVRLA